MLERLLSLGGWPSPQSHSGAENLWVSWRAAGFHFMSEEKNWVLMSPITVGTVVAAA